jgi:hypothetical protein
MPDRQLHPPKKAQSSPSGELDETRLESAGEVVVTHYTTPPKTRPDKSIHPRRPLPPVPESRPRREKDNSENT